MAENPARERATVHVSSLLPPTTAETFALWASKRGLTTSGAIRALIVDALVRELSASPLGPLYSDLPPDEAARIVRRLGERDTP